MGNVAVLLTPMLERFEVCCVLFVLSRANLQSGPLLFSLNLAWLSPFSLQVTERIAERAGERVRCDSWNG